MRYTELNWLVLNLSISFFADRYKAAPMPVPAYDAATSRINYNASPNEMGPEHRQGRRPITINIIQTGSAKSTPDQVLTALDSKQKTDIDQTNNDSSFRPLTGNEITELKAHSYQPYKLDEASRMNNTVQDQVEAQAEETLLTNTEEQEEEAIPGPTPLSKSKDIFLIQPKAQYNQGSLMNLYQFQDQTNSGVNPKTNPFHSPIPTTQTGTPYAVAKQNDYFHLINNYPTKKAESKPKNVDYEIYNVLQKILEQQPTPI